MSDSPLVSVLIGLAVGVGLIGLFILLPSQSSQGQKGNFVLEQPKIWVAKNVTPCNEPWSAEQTDLGDFFEGRSVKIYNIQWISYLPKDVATCSACDCKSGYTLYLRVNASADATMTKYGFVASQQLLSPDA